MKKKLTLIFLPAALTLTAGRGQDITSFSAAPAATIGWKPQEVSVKRYTVALHPFYIVNNGLRFDFEYELQKPGEWVQLSLIGYAAPPRRPRYYEDDTENLRITLNSALDNYEKMWGIGFSALYKKIWHSRGWYFSGGLTVEFYRVGRIDDGYHTWQQDGLTFYAPGRFLTMKSYVKPTAQFNLGKQMALSERCFIDLCAGVSGSYSIYDRRTAYPGDSTESYYETDYTGMYGFGRRGLNFNCGFRFGVLLWQSVR